MRKPARKLIGAATALASCLLFAVTAAPTSTLWVDRGGATMSVTAVNERPPEVVGPVTPDGGTVFDHPTWKGHGTTPPTPRAVCFIIEIFTSTPELSPWRVIIETDQPPFNNVSPFDGFDYQFFGEGASYGFEPAADYPLTGRYVMTPTQESQYASASDGYTATGCFNTPEPAWQPPGPTTYTQQEPVKLVRNGSQPCVAATVDGHQPYFIGFTVSFNWETFLNEQLAAGSITTAEYNQWLPYTHWAGGPPGYEASQGATGTDYLVTLQGYSDSSRNVYQVSPVTIASCSY